MNARSMTPGGGEESAKNPCAINGVGTETREQIRRPIERVYFPLGIVVGDGRRKGPA